VGEHAVHKRLAERAVERIVGVGVRL
jgi:hypothetical protein